MMFGNWRDSRRVRAAGRDDPYRRLRFDDLVQGSGVRVGMLAVGIVLAGVFVPSGQASLPDPLGPDGREASEAFPENDAGSLPAGEAEDFLFNSVEETVRAEGVVAFEELLAAAVEMRDHDRFREAERLYLRALDLSLPREAKRDAVLGLARLYEQYDSPVRAAGKYQRFLQLYPDDRERSDIQYSLGLLYRDMGMDDQALGWFYAVLSSVMALEREEIPAFRRLTRKAQFEIAKTWFYRGDYERARTFFSRISLLDLGEGDRQAVRFYLIKSTAHDNRHSEAVSDLENFIKDYPGSPLLPEALFLMADSLAMLERPDAAEEVLVHLLERGASSEDVQRQTWDYWRRRAGNHFGNRFYEEGDIFAALRIYQSIAELSDDPAWRWSTVYQIGLCLERLRHEERAGEAYAHIIGEGKKLAENEELTLELQNLVEMAEWRIQVLGWTGDIKKRFQDIISLNRTE